MWDILFFLFVFPSLYKVQSKHFSPLFLVLHWATSGIKSVEVLKVSWVHVNCFVVVHSVCFLDHPSTFGAPRVILSFFLKALNTFYRDCSIAHLWSSSLTCLTCWQKTFATLLPLNIFFFFSFGKKWYSVCRHVCICVKQFPNPRNVVLIKHLFFVKTLPVCKTVLPSTNVSQALAATVWGQAWLLSAIGACCWLIQSVWLNAQK